MKSAISWLVLIFVPFLFSIELLDPLSVYPDFGEVQLIGNKAAALVGPRAQDAAAGASLRSKVRKAGRGIVLKLLL